MLCNKLPNRGVALPQEIDGRNIHDVDFAVATRAINSVPEALGFALNDALTPLMSDKHASYKELALLLVQTAKQNNFESVLELGSGASLIEHCYDAGLTDYWAVDGNPLITEMCDFAKTHKDHFIALNLEDEIDFGQKFDLVLSFETFEHIQNTGNLMKTIRNHMHPNSWFIGTCSNNESDCHVVRCERDWWLTQLESVGLCPTGDSETFRQTIIPPHNWCEFTHLFIMRLQ